MNTISRVVLACLVGTLVFLAAAAAQARGYWWQQPAVEVDGGQDAEAHHGEHGGAQVDGHGHGKSAAPIEGYEISGCCDFVVNNCSGWWGGYARARRYSCAKPVMIWDSGCGATYTYGCGPAHHGYRGCGHAPCGHGKHPGWGHCGCGKHGLFGGHKGCGCEIWSADSACGCGHHGDAKEAPATDELPMNPPTPEPDTDVPPTPLEDKSA
jgi:hypothetical protein